MSSSIHVKSDCNGDLRRFSLPESESSNFARLQSQIAGLYGIVPPFTICYKDDEGDLVTLSSDAELYAATSICGSMLRLTISKPDSAPRAAQPAPAPTPVPAPRGTGNEGPSASARGSAGAGPSGFGSRGGLENVLESFAGLLSNIFTPGAGGPSFPHPGPHPPSPPFGRRRGFGRRGGCGGRGGWGGRGGGGFGGMNFDIPFNIPFGAMGNFIDPRFMEELRNVSPATREAFRSLVNDLRNSGNSDNIMRAVPTVIPTVRSWLGTDLGQSGAISQERIDTLVRDVNQQVQSALDEATRARIEAFARIALTDASVADLVRRISGIDAMFRGDDSSTPRPTSARGRLDVHRGIACDACGIAPIVGPRFKAVNRENYDICAICKPSDEDNAAGIEFQEIKYPWEADGESRLAPKGPLRTGDSGVEVMFLQKLLTDMGYMEPRMYRFWSGTYGPNTRRAVEAFQVQYGLDTICVRGVYDGATEASMTSILESNVPPTAATGGPAGDSGSASGSGIGSSSTPAPDTPAA